MLNNENLKSMVVTSKNSFVTIPPDIAKDKTFHPVARTIRDYWLIAQQWLIKLEWDSRWKIDVDKKTQELLKPRGVLLQQYYRLCERCHGMSDATGVKIPYRNAGAWVQTILTELLAEELSLVIYPPPVDNKNIKKSMLDFERNKSGMLRRGENPYEVYFTGEGASEEYLKPQALYLLTKSSLIAAHTSNVFKQGYWTPFLKAYSAHIAELNSSRWGRGYIEKKVYLKETMQNGVTGSETNYVVDEIAGKYFVQGGRGEGGTGRVLKAEIKQT